MKECWRDYKEDILKVGVYRWLCRGGKGEDAGVSAQGEHQMSYIGAYKEIQD